MSSHAPSTPLGGGSHSSTNSTEAAAAARLARIARQQVYNEKAAKFYGIAMAAVIVLFTLFHWSRFLYSRYSTRDAKTYGVMRLQVAITRYVLATN